MNKLFEQLAHTDKMLVELDFEKDAVMNLPYYEIFGNMSEKKRDILMIEEKKIKYLGERYTLLENIQIRSEIEKINTSTDLKNLKFKPVA